MSKPSVLNNSQALQNSPCIMIAAGGTGGHIFPAYTVAHILKSLHTVSLMWIGTSRNREKEVCLEAGIPLHILDVTGINKFLSFHTIVSIFETIRATGTMLSLMRKNKPIAVIAFGGYVCAPVLWAARLLRIPYFLHEQNAYLGRVNRLYWRGAKKVFLGFPIQNLNMDNSRLLLTGTPIRSAKDDYSTFAYPQGLRHSQPTVLISGGSQGAQSMNKCLLSTATYLVSKGCQVVWQTGSAGFPEISAAMQAYKSVFVFETLADLYPYFTIARAVICRSGASTLAEIAYFGLPCVMIPLPWAADNHQWINASIVEAQGWGIRIKQNENTGTMVASAVEKILFDSATFEKMSMRALDNSPAKAGCEIVETIAAEVKLT